MRKIIPILLSIFILFSFAGCNRILGGTILEFMGMEFTSQIEAIEEYLSVNLDDLTDDSIKTIYSFTDPDGNDLTIHYIDLEGTGEFVEKDISNSDKWCSLPYDSTIENLLDSYGANEQFDFAGIKDGYFIMSGVRSGKIEIDFDRNNFNYWYGFEIGIWDSNDETLYYISITDQSKV